MPSSRRHDLPDMALGPARDFPQYADQPPGQRRQRIFHRHRHGRIGRPRNQPVPLQALQSLGEHLLRDRPDPPPQIIEPHRTIPQRQQYQHRPFVPDPVEYLPCRAIGIISVSLPVQLYVHGGILKVTR